MKLAVSERIGVLQILPERGNVASLKILNQLRMSLAFVEDEYKEWGIETDPVNNRISWAEDGEADIPIGEVATGLIVDALREMDRKNDLPMQLLSIYEKFIPTTE